MIYGYARVSTNGQAQHGNSLEDQKVLLRDAGAQEIFEDVFTGTKEDRPELKILLETVKEGDVVMVTKLDRLARNAKGGIEIIDMMVDKGCSLHVLNMGLFNDTPTGRLMRTMLLAFAEFERDMIVERTLAGKEIARQREGYREGRKRKEVDFEGNYEKVKKGEMSIDEACKAMGISRRTYFSRKKEIA